MCNTVVNFQPEALDPGIVITGCKPHCAVQYSIN